MHINKIMLFILIGVLSSFIVYADDFTPTITSPTGIIAGSRGYTFSFDITNLGPNNIDVVTINRPGGFGNIACGAAPGGWVLSGSSNSYCNYTGGPLGIATETFTVNDMTGGVTGSYNWKVDVNHVSVGTMSKYPSSDVDADLPGITAASIKAFGNKTTLTSSQLIASNYLPEGTVSIKANITDSGGSGYGLIRVYWTDTGALPTLASSNVVMTDLTGIGINREFEANLTSAQISNAEIATFMIYALDAATNNATENKAGIGYKWTCDGQAPSPIVVTPIASSVIYNTKPRIEVMWTETGSGMNLFTTGMTLNGLPITLTGNNLTNMFYIPSTPLTQGIHTVAVYGNDSVGNSGSTSWSFTILEPILTSATIISPPTQEIVSGLIYITAQADGTDNINITKIDFYKDGIWQGVDTTEPYYYLWNTLPETNGSWHTWSALVTADSDTLWSRNISLKVNQSDAYYTEQETDARIAYYLGDVYYNLSLAWNNFSTIDSNIAQISSDITRIDNNLTLLWYQVYNFTSNLTSVYGNISDIRNNITLLWNTTNNISQNLMYVWSNITYINNRLIVYDGAITLLFTDISDLQNNLNSNITRIDNNLTWIQNRVYNFTSNLTSVYGNITRIDNNLTLVWNNLYSYTNNMTSIYGNISIINNDITDIRNNLTLVWSEIGLQNADILSILTDIANIQSNLNNNITRIDNNLTLVWNNLYSYTDNFTSVYGNITRIDNNLTLVWNKLYSSTDNLTSVWGNISIINNDITDIRNNLTLVWDAINLLAPASLTDIQNNLTAVYNNITRIDNNLTLVWNNLYSYTDNFTSVYGNITRIDNNLTLLWYQVYNFTSNLTSVYGNLTSVMDNLTLVWNATYNITNNLILVWNNLSIVDTRLNTLDSEYTLLSSVISDLHTNLDTNLTLIDSTFSLIWAAITGISSEPLLIMPQSQTVTSPTFNLEVNTSVAANCKYGKSPVDFIYLPFDMLNTTSTNHQVSLTLTEGMINNIFYVSCNNSQTGRASSVRMLVFNLDTSPNYNFTQALKSAWNWFYLPRFILEGYNNSTAIITNGNYSVENVLNSINDNYTFVAYKNATDWMTYATDRPSGLNDLNDFNDLEVRPYFIYVNNTHGVTINI